MITPSFGLTATERVLPKLALDFTTASLDNRVTFTRSLNTATVTNSSGNVVGINADLPRFDYDPITLACKGLLIEETRTNVLQYSQAFNSWSSNFASVSTDAVVSPDGTQNADTLLETTDNGEHYVYQAPNFTSGTSYSYSVYAKPAGRTILRIVAANTTTFPPRGFFDLSAKTASVLGGTGTITDVGNGWVRCTLSGTAGATSATQVRLVTVESGTTTSYVGDPTKGISLWGGQLEVSAFPTSYIPNLSTGTATRNADVAMMTGTNFSSWFNASEGTFTSTGILGSASTNKDLLSISDGTANNIIGIRWASGSQAQFSVTTLGSGQVNIAPAGYSTLNTAYKRTCGYKLDNFAQGINGTLTGTDTSGTVPTVDRAYIGASSTGGVSLNGWVQNIYYWPQKLTNAEITAFSKQG